MIHIDHGIVIDQVLLPSRIGAESTRIDIPLMIDESARRLLATVRNIPIQWNSIAITCTCSYGRPQIECN